MSKYSTDQSRMYSPWRKKVVLSWPYAVSCSQSAFVYSMVRAQAQGSGLEWRGLAGRIKLGGRVQQLGFRAFQLQTIALSYILLLLFLELWLDVAIQFPIWWGFVLQDRCLDAIVRADESGYAAGCHAGYPRYGYPCLRCHHLKWSWSPHQCREGRNNRNLCWLRRLRRRHLRLRGHTWLELKWSESVSSP